jgi:hypothetical protein
MKKRSSSRQGQKRTVKVRYCGKVRFRQSPASVLLKADMMPEGNAGFLSSPVVRLRRWV